MIRSWVVFNLIHATIVFNFKQLKYPTQVGKMVQCIHLIGPLFYFAALESIYRPRTDTGPLVSRLQGNKCISSQFVVFPSHLQSFILLAKQPCLLQASKVAILHTWFKCENSLIYLDALAHVGPFVVIEANEIDNLRPISARFRILKALSALRAGTPRVVWSKSEGLLLFRRMCNTEKEIGNQSALP